MTHYSITPHSKHKSGIPIYSTGGKVVGTVSGDTFHKVINGSKHLFRNPPGIGSDVSALIDAKAAGAAWMEVYDRESGITYKAKIETVYTKGIARDYGFGSQLILSFQFWGTIKAGDAPVAQISLPLGI